MMVAFAVLVSCVSTDMRQELDARRAEVSKLEAHLLKLAPDDPKSGAARKAVAEARGRLEQVRKRADRERRDGLGFFGGLFDKLISGASPLIGLLVPGGGLVATMGGSLLSRLTSLAVGAFSKGG